MVFDAVCLGEPLDAYQEQEFRLLERRFYSKKEAYELVAKRTDQSRSSQSASGFDLEKQLHDELRCLAHETNLVKEMIASIGSLKNETPLIGSSSAMFKLCTGN